jgi:hypothetical protein
MRARSWRSGTESAREEDNASEIAESAATPVCIPSASTALAGAGDVSQHFSCRIAPRGMLALWYNFTGLVKEQRDLYAAFTELSNVGHSAYRRGV